MKVQQSAGGGGGREEYASCMPIGWSHRVPLLAMTIHDAVALGAFQSLPKRGRDRVHLQAKASGQQPVPEVACVTAFRRLVNTRAIGDCL